VSQPLLFSGTNRAGSWRNLCRTAIADALRGTEALPEDEAVARIDAAFPFGERKYYPYKVWLEERRAAIGRLRGVHLSANARATEMSEELVRLKPVPELEAWLRRSGRRAADAERDREQEGHRNEERHGSKTPTVRIGQVWESCDKHEIDPLWGRKGGPKRLRVERIVPYGIIRYAECVVVNANPGERATTRIRLDRFKETSTGYRLVSEPADA